MIINISPPSKMSLRNIEKLTQTFFRGRYSISKNKFGMLAIESKSMVLIKKCEILLSFSPDDKNTIIFLQNYLSYLFGNMFIGVDLENPITDNLNFAINLPRRIVP